MGEESWVLCTVPVFNGSVSKSATVGFIEEALLLDVKGLTICA
jgi:hypothetical protein